MPTGNPTETGGSSITRSIGNDQVYEETLMLHKQQLTATEASEKRAQRSLELNKLREEIMEKCEGEKMARQEIEIQKLRRQYEWNKKRMELNAEREKLMALIEQQQVEELNMVGRKEVEHVNQSHMQV